MFVSIVIPTFNRAGPVCRAIDSVLRQSHEDFELIVIDDGSNDETERWLSYYDDERFSVVPVTHGGVARARNIGASLAHAEWLCFLDSDDLWHTHKLREQMAYHQASPDCAISQTDDIWIRHSRRVNKMAKHQPFGGDLFAASLERCMITCSTVMIRKDIFFKAGGFDETFAVCEDYDLWLRLAAQHQIGFVNEKLATKFGGHADQLSRAYPVMDQFRIRAIESLLTNPSLTPTQSLLAKTELARKRDIVEKGSRKRGVYEET